MNCPLFYRYGALLFAFGVIEVATMKKYIMSKADFGGHHLGSGFLVFLPDPIHIVYVESDNPYSGAIQLALNEAGDDDSRFPALNTMIDMYRAKSPIPPNYDINRFLYYKSYPKINAVEFRYDDLTFNVLTFFKKTDREAFEHKLTLLGAEPESKRKRP